MSARCCSIAFPLSLSAASIFWWNDRQWDRIPWPERVGFAQLARAQNPKDPTSVIMAVLEFSHAGKTMRAEFGRALDEAVDNPEVV